MTRAGVGRLLALVLACGIVSVIPTVVTDLLTDQSQTPPSWTGLVCTTYVVVLVLLVVQAVRRTDCGMLALALVVVGNLACATYPYVAVAGRADEAPWVLSLSLLTVGAGTVATSSLSAALGLTVLHLGLRLVLQVSGTWTAAPDDAVFDALGLLVLATASSVAVHALQQTAAQVDAARDLAGLAAAEAASAEAAEYEHTRWDGIVHDDVLAALAMTAHARDDADRIRAREAAVRALASIDHDPDVDAGPVEVAAVGLRLHAAVLGLHPAADVELLPAPAGRLAAETADALVAAVSEAVRNAVRHGRSADGTIPAVRVRLAPHPLRGRLTVEVRDSGAGFDPGEATVRLGLAVSVRRRADVVGGSAVVRSVPGVGTVVLLGVPLLPADEPTDERENVRNHERDGVR